jgi:hypothetical protein
VNAKSPEEAYAKSLDLGADSQVSYENPGGRRVSNTFRGLADLNVIHDRLEHGAELMYEEDKGVAAEQISSWVRPKNCLSVFKGGVPACSDELPDYSSAEVVQLVEEMIDGS